MKKELIKTEKQSFFYFPEKLNKLSLMTIVVLFGVVVFVVLMLVFPKKSYEYIPEDYEEMLYSEDLNTAFAITSSYTYNTSDKK